MIQMQLAFIVYSDFTLWFRNLANLSQKLEVESYLKT